MRALTVLTSIMCLILLPLVNAKAETTHSENSFLNRFGAVIGAGFDLGTMQNNGLQQDARWMDALSAEGLIGYKFGPAMLGADVDYRVVGQLSGLDSAGGTNLAGKGWLFGLGGTLDLSPRWSLQAAVDFLGTYKFDHQTESAEDDHLSSPLVLRIKGQYYPSRNYPLSLDADAQYASYGVWRVSEKDYSDRTNSFFVGVGVSWHFGGNLYRDAADAEQSRTDSNKKTGVTSEVVTVPTATLHTDQLQDLQTQLEKVVHTTKTETGLTLEIKSDTSFSSGSSELNPEAEANLAKTASILAKESKSKIRIEGHCDSSGNKHSNLNLSRKRAAQVKHVFLSNGFTENQIEAVGLGDSKPIQSNTTAEGRAANRRVEIHVIQI